MGVVGPSQRNLRRWGMLGNSNKTNDNPISSTKEVIKPSIEEKFVSKEDNSMKCKKVSIMDAIGHDVFLENYGIATISCYRYAFNVGRGEQVSPEQLFKATNADYFESLSRNGYGVDVIRNESWDSETYYMRDPNKSNNDYYYDYGYNHSLRKGQEKEVKIKSLSITFSISYQTSFGQNNTAKKELTLEFKNKKEMNDYTVLLLEGFDEKELKHPALADIKPNDLFYCVCYGVAKVEEVYKYPNRKNLICDVITERGGKIGIDAFCSNLYYLPYDEPQNQLLILDKCDNELALMPYVIREGQTFNVYWKSMEEAADYIVSLYKIIEANGRKDLYHLNDYIVERNENMFVISGLIGNTFVFKVSAEDRSGKKIAVSRGIVNGFPTYLAEEE